MGEDPRLAAAADALAAAYLREIELPAPVFGILFAVYDQGDYPYDFVQPPVAIPLGKLAWCAEHDRLDELWMPYDPPEFAGEELRHPPMEGELLAVCEALLEDDPEPLGALFVALAARLHAALGVLVIHDLEDHRSIREQLELQLAPDVLAEWRANDWLERDRSGDRALAELDVVLHARTGPDRVAGVFRRHGKLCFTSALGRDEHGRELTKAIVPAAGSDPVVLAGLLPAGAVSVAVQDLFDVWHDALIADGAWLCVLPHGDLGPPPPVRFRDGAGAEIELAAEPRQQWMSVGLEALPGSFDREAFERDEAEERRSVLARAPFKPLWPPDAGEPELSGWGWTGEAGPVDDLTLTGGDLSVRVCHGVGVDFANVAVRQELERTLENTREAARAVVEAEPLEVPGQVGTRKAGFTALAARGRWVAVWNGPGFDVVVSGAGEPPARIELREVTSGT